MARYKRDAPELSLLFLVPAAYIAAFSFSTWHGGLSLNLRYFVPVLLFTSILVSYGWRELVQLSGAPKWGHRAGAIVAAALVAVVAGVTPLSLLPIEVLETVLLPVPLLLRLALLVVLVAQWISPRIWRRALANGTVAGLVVAFAWAGTVAFTYDYPRAWAKRALLHEISSETAAFVPADSIVFVEFATPLSGLYELDRVRLAQATWDEFQGFRALLDFHLEAGRPVYGWFQPVTWEELDEDGLLSGLRAVPIHEVGWGGLAQIVKVTSAAADIGSQVE